METTDPTTDCAPLPSWCRLLDKTAKNNSDGDAPTQPIKLFQWICAQNLPLLEDETPPISFYEVYETAKIAYHCDRCSKQFVAQLLHRSTGTQTIAQQRDQLEAEAQTIKTVHVQVQQSSYSRLLFCCTDGQTQTTQNEIARIMAQQGKEEEEAVNETTQAAAQHARTQAQAETQTATISPLLSSRLPVAIPNSSEALPLPQPLLVVVQDAFTLRLRGRSLWSLLKTLLVIISVVHGCYVLGGSLYRLPLLRRLLIRAQSICGPQSPQPLQPPQPPPSRSLPSFIWGQLCRLSRKLHIV